MLAQRIQGILGEHVGPILAQTAIEHCCDELGVAQGDLSPTHLWEFASVLHKRLAPFLGVEAAAGLAQRVRRLGG